MKLVTQGWALKGGCASWDAEIHAAAVNIPKEMERGPMMMRFFTGMHSAGYRVFAVEPNHNPAAPAGCCFEYAFIKTDSEGYVVRPFSETPFSSSANKPR